jgi:hypothetical protein
VALFIGEKDTSAANAMDVDGQTSALTTPEVDPPKKKKDKKEKKKDQKRKSDDIELMKMIRMGSRQRRR